MSKILENIFEEPSKAVGNTFSDIWYLALGAKLNFLSERKRIELNVGLEKYKNQTKIEIQKIPDKDRVEADIQVVGNILEMSKFCVEKEVIRNMFSKLIASAMDVKKTEIINNSFAFVVSMLAVDEALILSEIYKEYINNGNRFALVDIRWVEYNKIDEETGFNIVCEVRDKQVKAKYINKENDEFKQGATVFKDINLLGIKARCQKPKKISTYLQNLKRNGIIDIENRSIVYTNEYIEIIESQFVKELLLSCDIEKEYHDYNKEKYFIFIQKYIYLTEFGKDLLNCCLG